MADLYTVRQLDSAVYTNTANWIGGSGPTAADNVFFQFIASQALDGSNQSSTELGNITVLPTCSGDAGSAAAYLQLDQAGTKTVTYAGGGTWYLDMGTSGSTSVRVDRTRAATNGEAGLYFKNATNAITTFEVNGGVVRLVDANITSLVVRNNATVIIESACTVTAVIVDGGSVTDYGAAITTWNQTAGVGVRYGNDAYIANLYGGVLYNDTTGAATVTCYGGIFDSERDNRAKSVVLTMNGGTARIGPNVTLTDTINTGVTISA